MKYKIVKTLEDWTKIQSMGTYEQDYRNGELCKKFENNA